MYTVPDFSSGVGSSGGTPSSDMLRGNEGMNQWMAYPTMGGGAGGPSGGYPMPMTSAPPGVVPPTNTTPSPSPTGYQGQGYPSNLTGAPGAVGATGRLPGNQETVPTTDPLYTQAFDQWMRQQLGTGITPFNLSSILPTSGQPTTPGSLTAPENQVMQSLQNFYLTGQGGPLPGVLPMWQAEMGAMQQPIQQNLANLKEQFGSMGALGSTEMGTAMENYLSQTSADEMALLTSASQQALPGMSSFAGGLQSLDQSSISNLLNEFNYTQPQNNPLNSMMESLALSYPPTYGKQGFTEAFGQSFGSASGQGLGQFLFG